MSTIPVGISLPRELMEEIDLQRGDIPRSKYIVRALKAYRHSKPKEAPFN